MIRALSCLAVLASAAPAAAEPFADVGVDASPVFEPFEGLPARGVLSVTAGGFEAADPAVAVRLNGGGALWALDGPSGPLVFAFDAPFAPGPDAERGPVAPLETDGEDVRAVLGWELSADQYAEPGLYGALVDVIVFDRADGAVLARRDEVRLEALVEPRAQANIAGAASGGGMSVPLIDFGVLETGESHVVSVQVRANVDARIDVRSDHGGRMKLDHPGAEHYVGYSVTFGGEPVDLASGTQILRRPEASLAGSAYALEARVGEVGHAPSGAYRDYIRIEVTAR